MMLYMTQSWTAPKDRAELYDQRPLQLRPSPCLLLCKLQALREKQSLVATLSGTTCMSLKYVPQFTQVHHDSQH